MQFCVCVQILFALKVLHVQLYFCLPVFTIQSSIPKRAISVDVVSKVRIFFHFLKAQWVTVKCGSKQQYRKVKWGGCGPSDDSIRVLLSSLGNRSENLEKTI